MRARPETRRPAKRRRGRTRPWRGALTRRRLATPARRDEDTGPAPVERAPGTGNPLLDRLGELAASLSLRGETFIRDVTPRAEVSLRYRSVLRATLMELIDEIEEVSATAGALDPYLSPSHARLAADRVGEVLEMWTRVNTAIDLAVVRALRGESERSFQLLSPVANSHNLRGRRRMQRLYGDLNELASRNRPAPEPRPDAPQAAAPPGEAWPLDLLPPAPDSAPELDDEEDLAPLLEASDPPAQAEDLDYTGVFDEAGAPGGDDAPFDECLARLESPHEIERSDALVELLRRHQHQLVAHLIRGAAAEDPLLEHLLELLWHNVEVVLLDDYFYSARRSKLTGFLELAAPYPVAARFRRLLALLRPGPTGYPAPADALALIEAHDPDQLATYLRALVVHPLEEYRRHATAALEPADLWAVIAFPHTPLPALATLAERLAAPEVPDDYRKVFFDCTLKTLAAARDEAAIKAARRILGTLFRFDFFLEDEYFRKITGLNQVIAREEERLGRPSYLGDSVRRLRREKARVGEQKTRTPVFDGVPLTVQRLLAREGFHTLLFTRHPDAKIALETLRHLRVPGLVERALRQPDVNALLLSELARREDLITTRAARLALLGNPHTPLRAVYGYVPLLSGEDLRRLAVSKDVNPDVAAYLTRLLQRKGVRVR